MKSTDKDEGGIGVIGRIKAARRKVLAGVGASALVTSVSVFGGKAQQATAAGFGPLCCNLAHYPQNTTYAYCSAHAAYIWYCDVNGYLHCNCCETANNALSAAYCHYN